MQRPVFNAHQPRVPKRSEFPLLNREQQHVDPDRMCTGHLYDHETGVDLRPALDTQHDGALFQPPPPATCGTVRFRAPMLNELRPAPLATQAPPVTGTRVPLSDDDMEHRNDWPIHTDSHCWWDTYPFEGPPVGLPLLYHERSNTYECYGFFCSLSCALAYFCREMHHMNRATVQVWVDRIAQQVFHQPVPVLRAHARCELERFGGTLCIEDFRARNKYSNAAELPYPQRVPFRMMQREVQETLVLARAPYTVLAKHPREEARTTAPHHADMPALAEEVAPKPLPASAPIASASAGSSAPKRAIKAKPRSRLETTLGIVRVKNKDAL